MLGWLLGGMAAGALLGGKQETTYVVHTNRHERKVRFYDTYRKLDRYLAGMVNAESGGISLLIQTTNYLWKRTGNSNCHFIASTLENIRAYRNRISHNERRWAEIPDVSSETISALETIYNWVWENSDEVEDMLWNTVEYNRSRALNS